MEDLFEAYTKDQIAYANLDLRTQEQTESLYHLRQIHRLLSILVDKQKLLFDINIKKKDDTKKSGKGMGRIDGLSK